MTLSVTIVSGNDLVLRLVQDFARGLGCRVDMGFDSSGQVRIEVGDEQSLVEVLTHVALSAAKAGVDVAEPLCHVSYQHTGVTSNMTLTLRIADVRIGTANALTE